MFSGLSQINVLKKKCMHIIYYYFTSALVYEQCDLSYLFMFQVSDVRKNFISCICFFVCIYDVFGLGRKLSVVKLVESVLSLRKIGFLCYMTSSFLFFFCLLAVD